MDKTYFINNAHKFDVSNILKGEKGCPFLSMASPTAFLPLFMLFPKTESTSFSGI